MKKAFYLLSAIFIFLFTDTFAQPTGSFMYNPIDVGVISPASGVYTDTKNNDPVNGYTDDNYTPSDDIYYKFTLTSYQTVNISHCGSGMDTHVVLLDEFGSDMTSNDNDGPLCAGGEASIQIDLAPGTYYVVSEGFWESGNITTSIRCGGPIPNGAMMSNALAAGTGGGCTPLSFSDTKNNSPQNFFGNEIGQPSDDIYYAFTVTSDATVNISTCGSAIDTYLSLQREDGLVVATNDNDGPLCAGLNASIQMLLGPGTYYLAAEGAGTTSGAITTSITISGTETVSPQGAYRSNAIDAGNMVSGQRYFSSLAISECYGNEVGDYPNDAFYKFTLLSNNAEVNISTCWSHSSPMTSLYLFDADGNEIARALMGGNSCQAWDSNYRASLTKTLAAGTYYVAVEDYFSPAWGVETVIKVGAVRPQLKQICTPLPASLSQNHNYVATYTPRKALSSWDEATLTTRPVCEVNQTIEYYDGLGRPMQIVHTKASPTGADIIEPIKYDKFGRQEKEYLPYTHSLATASGSYRSNDLERQASFYTSPPSGVTPTAYPFAETKFEASPLSRVLEQGTPGAAWQLNTNGHYQRFEYAHNTSALFQFNKVSSKRVALYRAQTGSNGVSILSRDNNAVYSDNELYVTISKNENWTADDGCLNTVEDYTDKTGRTIVSRTYNKNENEIFEMLSTYYVYDQYGNLSFVLPPSVEPDNSSSISQTVLDNFCFQYRYDDDNRVVGKKVPGKGWEFIVYNKLNQLVLTQDANQRSKTPQQWTFAKYDVLGRTVMTGIYEHASSTGDNNISSPSNTIRLALQSQSDGQSILWEKRDNTGTHGYTNDALPKLGVNTYLSVNYYDDYAIPNLPAAYMQQDYSKMTAGLPTATKTAVLNNNSDMLWNVVYYDDEGRAVKTFNQHYLGSTFNHGNVDEISVTYNFNDQQTTDTRVHKVSGTVKVNILTEYEYDHTGSPVNIWKTIKAPNQSAAPVLISHVDYNEIGQPVKKSLHAVNEALPADIILDADDAISSPDTKTVLASRSITLLPGFTAGAGSTLTASIQSQGTTPVSSDFLQHIAYTYNERGWMNTSSADLFKMELVYDTPSSGTLDPSKRQYNGNISRMRWGNTLENTFDYTYDNLQRLSDAASTGMNEQVGYDKVGNITKLTRDGNVIDYAYYPNSNQLKSVTGGGLANGIYEYDPNGNAVKDGSRSNMNITYNLLDLPQAISGSKSITYTYDATGKMWSMHSTSMGRKDYIYGIQYAYVNGNAVLEFIKTEEGRAVRKSDNTYKYEYDLEDHLGNVRVTFQKSPTTGSAEIIQADDYYAFGKRKSVPLTSGAVSLVNKYLYNGKDIQEELGQYDYGARFYDPETARWNVVDPLAEMGINNSPYVYVNNNPLSFIDPDGRNPLNWILPAGSNQPVWNPLIFNQAMATAFYGKGTEFWGKTHQYKSSDGPLVDLYTINGKPAWDWVYPEIERLPYVQTWAAFQDGVRGNMPALKMAEFIAENTAAFAAGGVAPAATVGGSIVARGLGGIAANAARIGSALSRGGRSVMQGGAQLLGRLSGRVATKGGSSALPQIGDKLKYVFGKATGSAHNIQRSTDMARQLNAIGVFDNAAGNAYLRGHLGQVLNTTEGIIQSNGRTLRESLLTGPNGGLKMESIWEGTKLITIKLIGK